MNKIRLANSIAAYLHGRAMSARHGEFAPHIDIERECDDRGHPELARDPDLFRLICERVEVCLDHGIFGCLCEDDFDEIEYEDDDDEDDDD